MITNAELATESKPLQTEDLANGLVPVVKVPQKYKRGWFHPPVWDPQKRYERDLWWVGACVELLAESVKLFAAANPTETQEFLRARAACAADRALLAFWLGRFRRTAYLRRIPPERVAQDLRVALGVVQAGQQALREAIGPELAHGTVPGAVRAARRRTHAHTGIAAHTTWEDLSERVEPRA